MDRTMLKSTRARAVLWRGTAVLLASALAAGVLAAPQENEVAEEHLRRAEELLELDDAASYRQALESLDAARRSAAEFGNPALHARILRATGATHLALDDSSTALQFLQRCLTLAEDPGVRALALRDAGVAQRRLGRFEDAQASYQQVIEIARQLDDRELTAEVLLNLGTLHYARGAVGEAYAPYRQALAIYRGLGNREGELEASTNLGVLYWADGRLSEAEAHLAEGLAQVRQLGRREDEMTLLNNLGAVYRSQGKIQKALDAFVHGLELAEELDDRWGEAALALSLGEVYKLLRERDKALALYQRALALHQEMGSGAKEAARFMDLGWFYLADKDPAAALPYLEQALQKSQANEDRRVESDALQGLGKAHLDLADAAKALAFLTRALAVNEEVGGNGLRRAGILTNLGAAYRDLGRAEEARGALERALGTLEPFSSPERESAVHFELAQLHRSQGALGPARQEAETALGRLESLRESIPSPLLRATLLSGRQELFDFYVDLLMELAARDPDGGLEAAAFEASERSRSRALVELLTEASFDLRSPLDPGLAAQMRETTARISWLQRRILRTAGNPDVDAEKTDLLRRDLETAEAQREHLEQEIRTRDPRYAAIRYPSPITSADAGALLDGETAFLEYSLGEHRSFLFVLTREGLAVRELAPAGEIVRGVRALRHLLERPRARLQASLEGAAQDVYALLVAPAADLLGAKSRLLIAPDLDLYYLPFELLRDAEPPGGWLLERWAVAYVPSASVLKILRSKSNANPMDGSAKVLVAFADPSTGSAPPPEDGREARRGPGASTVRQWQPLPHAREEVSAVARFYPEEAVALYLGADATEENVKSNRLVASAHRLHFASHAFVDEERPAASGLVLSTAASGDEDGLLQAREIFGLELTADLVVLSACETGLGRQVAGEGLIGLTQAFLFAGTRRIVVSLWQVSDRSTSDLMVRFYAGLEDGLDETQALREAKLELIRQGHYDHPFYWAPFILVGDPFRRR